MKPKEKALVILSPAFPENEAATWWVPSQQDMVKALQQNNPGLRILVLAFYYPYQKNSYTWHQLPVIPLHGTSYRKHNKLLFWWKTWRTLRQLHRQYQITGLFSFWCGECALAGKYFGKWHGIPHITWICGQDARSFNKLVRFIRPRPHQLAAMTPFLVREFYKNHGIRPAHIIPNAIDPAFFPVAVHAERDIDILGVGSFEPLKQYPLMVEVVGRLAQHIPGIQAYHCGMGVEKEKVEATIDQWQLENNFFLLGGRDRGEIMKLMQRTKVLLHPSRYEGCGNVMLEALYAGAHVISFTYPYDEPVPHWHVVKTPEEMFSKALEILLQTETDHSPVLLHEIQDSARLVMQVLQASPVALPVPLPSPV